MQPTQAARVFGRTADNQRGGRGKMGRRNRRATRGYKNPTVSEQHRTGSEPEPPVSLPYVQRGGGGGVRGSGNGGGRGGLRVVNRARAGQVRGRGNHSQDWRGQDNVQIGTIPHLVHVAPPTYTRTHYRSASSTSATSLNSDELDALHPLLVPTKAKGDFHPSSPPPSSAFNGTADELDFALRHTYPETPWDNAPLITTATMSEYRRPIFDAYVKVTFPDGETITVKESAANIIQGYVHEDLTMFPTLQEPEERLIAPKRAAGYKAAKAREAAELHEAISRLKHTDPRAAGYLYAYEKRCLEMLRLASDTHAVPPRTEPLMPIVSPHDKLSAESGVAVNTFVDLIGASCAKQAATTQGFLDMQIFDRDEQRKDMIGMVGFANQLAETAEAFRVWVGHLVVKPAEAGDGDATAEGDTEKEAGPGEVDSVEEMAGAKIGEAASVEKVSASASVVLAEVEVQAQARFQDDENILDAIGIPHGVEEQNQPTTTTTDLNLTSLTNAPTLLDDPRTHPVDSGAASLKLLLQGPATEK